MTGALLSIIALSLNSDFIIISCACYIAVFVLDGGLVILMFVLGDEKKINKTIENTSPSVLRQESIIP